MPLNPLNEKDTMNPVRPAAVAGSFYPDRPEQLAEEVRSLLQAAAMHEPASPSPPKALIVPHAGYIYSGPIAASAYALLAPWRNVIQRVVLIGPVHRVPVRGLALPQSGGFETPLGVVPLDTEAMLGLARLPQVSQSAAAHAWEHSLEVQLPFLQQALGAFSLVPLAAGDATPDEVAGVLDALWGGQETLIVISSDLSHYLPYATAKQFDESTAEAILQLRLPLNHEQACGGTPINGLLLEAKRRHLRPELLDLRNSGDTAGDRNRVVGYGAFAFFEENTLAH